MTDSTSNSEITSAMPTSFNEASMKTDLSKFVSSSMPSGRPGRRRSTVSFTPCATCSVLAFDTCTTPRLTPAMPSEREIVRSLSAPRRTSATSPRRTR